MKIILIFLFFIFKNYIFLLSNCKFCILETLYLYKNILLYFFFKDVTLLVNIYFYLCFLLQI